MGTISLLGCSVLVSLNVLSYIRGVFSEVILHSDFALMGESEKRS